MNVVDINITDFSVSIGGEHLYASLSGHIDGKYERFSDIQHPLSQKEATYLNKKDSEYGGMSNGYKKGDMSERFESYDDVKRYVKLVWKDHFPDGELLVLDIGTIPEAVDGDPKVVEEINKLHEECEALWYQKKNYSRWYCKDEDRSMELQRLYFKIIEGE
jgi:hypothetical protein